MNKITDRILNQLGDKQLIDKLLALSKSDLNSLLLDVYHQQASRISPADVLKAFESNRFSVPSEVDPVEYLSLQADFLSLAQRLGIKAVLLSPSAPFAGCSAFGCVDQNNVVSATRGVEILSDPTNMLALIIAKQLKDKEIDNTNSLHYCTTARVLRAQVFPATKGYYSHFGMFCMVSSGKDSGSYTCEKELLVKQLSYYKRLLIEKYDAKLSVILRKRRGYTDGDGFFDSMSQLVSDALPDTAITFDLDHEENNYYKGINFCVYMEKDSESIEIGDGGFVNWIGRMLNNKKERCLISAIGLDRLLLR